MVYDNSTGTILQGPENVTAFQNERITFTCRIEVFTSIDTDWFINDDRHQLVTSDAIRNMFTYNNSTMDYTYGDYFFHMTARAEYNNSKIKCRYTPYYIPVWVYTCSDNAILTIQGIIYIACLCMFFGVILKPTCIICATPDTYTIVLSTVSDSVYMSGKAGVIGKKWLMNTLVLCHAGPQHYSSLCEYIKPGGVPESLHIPC